MIAHQGLTHAVNLKLVKGQSAKQAKLKSYKVIFSTKPYDPSKHHNSYKGYTQYIPR
jgi:hypothetical protein